MSVVSLLLMFGSCSRNTIDNATLTGNVPNVQGLNASPKNKMNEQISSEKDPWSRDRLDMVEQQIRRRGIRDERVLDAMKRIPRHLFVPENLHSQAYDDCPLPIGYHQTISQPYIVALMTELVKPQPSDRALDIGTGCGYQAAVLSELVKEVYSIEIVEPLAEQARSRLKRLGHHNVEVRFGDGYQGWPEKAPFQIIVVAAAPDHVPQPLLDQLALGGRLVIPVGSYSQELVLIEKSLEGALKRTRIAGVAFVPMTGTAEEK
ncbi:MAG: protein-L-isoaspartate(D-aspartate) O-methyltransferase [Pirellula sp.]